MALEKEKRKKQGRYLNLEHSKMYFHASFSVNPNAFLYCKEKHPSYFKERIFYLCQQLRVQLQPTPNPKLYLNESLQWNKAWNSNSKKLP